MRLLQNKNTGSLLIRQAVCLFCVGLTLLIMPACKKDKSQSHLAVRMTDAPGNFDAVLIDVQSIEITGSGGSAVTLNTTAGIYNLLDLTNGINTLIATGDLEAGTVSQIRLILGPNNAVMVDSILYPLSTPSAQQSGLKLQIHQTFEPGVSYSILLDFDAAQSIVTQGNGGYLLKPVIRTIDVAITGSIKGNITPLGVIATVSATANGITYTSMTNANGEFLIAGLPAGTYDVTVTPPLPLLPVTLPGKTVTTGTSTNVGVVTL